MKEIKNLLGQPIQSDEMKAFFENYGFKYPKRDAISSKSGDDNFWVENKKLGVELWFKLEIFNPKYPPVLDTNKRKGMYIPILTKIYIPNPSKHNIEFPYKINSQISVQEVINTFGEFNYSKPGKRYYMEKLIDEEKDVEVFFNLNRDKTPKDKDIQIGIMSFRIKSPGGLPELYVYSDTHVFENRVEPFTESQKLALETIEWIIINGGLRATNKKIAEGIQKIQEDKIDILTFCKEYLNRGYILESDLFVNKEALQEHKEKTNYASVDWKSKTTLQKILDLKQK